MLVLKRNMNQSILIGDNIRITVCKIGRCEGSVRIGIEAPKEVRIDREEVAEARAKSPRTP